MAKTTPPSSPPAGGYVGAQHPSWRRARKPAQNMLVGQACPTEFVQAGKTYLRPLATIL